ncbi:MAG: NYN domain-containing protein [Pseudonocardiaceae bacterium]
MDRVKAYVDGFNLYHGLKAKHGRKYLWLDLQALALRLIQPAQHLVEVEYFTARVRNQPESEQRQAAYLDALAAQCPLVKVVQGRVQEKTHECWTCGGRWVSYQERSASRSAGRPPRHPVLTSQRDPFRRPPAGVLPPSSPRGRQNDPDWQPGYWARDSHRASRWALAVLTVWGQTVRH